MKIMITIIPGTGIFLSLPKILLSDAEITSEDNIRDIYWLLG